MAWQKSWTVKAQTCTHALSVGACLQNLLAEGLPDGICAQGSSVHWRNLMRLTWLMMHARRPAEEGWVERHHRTRRKARPMLLQIWGEDPDLNVGACAVVAVVTVATRPVCSVLGGTLL